MTSVIDLPETAPDVGVQRPARSARLWTAGFVVATLALMAGAVVSMHETWADIANIALTDEEASQVFLVPVIAGWFLWARRERLRGYVPRFTWLGPVFIVAGWALNRLGDVYLFQSMWHFGAVVVLAGAVVSIAGGGFFVRFLPVFASLCFLVPIPGMMRQSIAIPLQTASAEVTRVVLETFGVDVQRVGNMLKINGHDVMVAEACNGLRMVFALTVVSFAFAYGVPLRNWVRVLIVVLSPVTAIVFNVVRLVPTVWAYGRYSEAVGLAVHDVGSWVMLPVAFLSLLGLMRLLRWAQVPITPYVLAYGS